MDAYSQLQSQGANGQAAQGSGQQQQQQMQQQPGPPMTQRQQQEQRQNLNNLFKTQLCKHFQQTGHCAKGQSCHFAHGDYELRKKDDQLPLEVQYKMLNIPYNNFKTQKCKYFDQEKQCRFGRNCTYAHGEYELRQPYEQLPEDALPNLEITNPNAFRLLQAQMNAFEPRIVLNQPNDNALKMQVLEANKFLQADQKEQGYQILQTMLNNSQISMQYQPQPPASAQEAASDAFKTQQDGYPSADLLGAMGAMPHGAAMDDGAVGITTEQMSSTLQAMQQHQFPMDSSQIANSSYQVGGGQPGSQGATNVTAGQQAQPFGAGLMYTPIAGESSAVDRAAWGMTQ